MPTASPTFLLCLHEGACLCNLTYFWCFLCFFVVDWCNVSDSPLRIQHTHTVPSCKFRIFCLHSADDDGVVDQTGNAEYLTHHTVLSGCDDDVEDFPPFPSRLTTPETTETRIFSSRYSPLPFFCFFVRFFFCFSHTLTRSDFPISVTKSSSVGISLLPKRNVFFQKRNTVHSFCSFTDPSAGGIVFFNQRSQVITLLLVTICCVLDLPEPNNDNFPIGE